MLLREVGYARPSTVDEPIALLGFSSDGVLEIGAMESPSPVAPLGAKGLGEGGGGGIHCVCAAIQDAPKAARNAIVYDSCTPPRRVWSMLQDPQSTRANVSVVSR